MNEFGFSIQLKEVDFKKAVDSVVEALKAEGFGIITEIDVQATFKKKLDIDYTDYRILGACNPGLAHQVLDQEPELGLLLPCNVLVRRSPENKIMVSFMDPVPMMKILNNSKVLELATQVKNKMESVSKKLN